MVGGCGVPPTRSALSRTSHSPAVTCGPAGASADRRPPAHHAPQPRAHGAFHSPPGGHTERRLAPSCSWRPAASRGTAGRQVVGASSSAVYGSNPAPLEDERECVRPLSPYAVSKLATEQYLLTYQTCYDVQTVAFRFFDVYGPASRRTTSTRQSSPCSSTPCSRNAACRCSATASRRGTSSSSGRCARSSWTRRSGG
ncbi:NAD-dependent epimerase/dehydratase family protein [Geodermatophilus obscurus]|uniref:NAD-dependent epimerase/dehydratase family protein n=1 Tax=Geodermatophilus obscurus TaxID=1861 RepID=UPI00093247B4